MGIIKTGKYVIGVGALSLALTSFGYGVFRDIDKGGRAAVMSGVGHVYDAGETVYRIGDHLGEKTGADGNKIINNVKNNLPFSLAIGAGLTGLYLWGRKKLQ